MSKYTIIQVSNSKLQGFLNNHPLLDVLFIVESGSALWGLKNESSDTDFTGVYLPSIEECILGDFPKIIKADSSPQEKNTSEDVDIKLLSIHQFIHNVIRGDSDSVACLFAPKEQVEFYNEHFIVLKKAIPKLINRMMIQSALGGAKSRKKGWEVKQDPKLLYHACRFLYIAFELVKHKKVCLPIRPQYNSLFQEIKNGNEQLGLKVYEFYEKQLANINLEQFPKSKKKLGQQIILGCYNYEV